MTPTPGIEPTIRRIAEEVAREYLGRILGASLGAQRAPRDPAPVGELSPNEPGEEDVYVRDATDWVRNRTTPETKGAGAKDSKNVTGSLADVGCSDGDRGMAGVSSPVTPETGGATFSARMSNAPSLPPDGPDEPEAKGAPEQARFVKDDDGYWIETRDESEKATVFIPANVVDRRKAAEWQEMHAALGSHESVSVLDGIRGVVAERDAALVRAQHWETSWHDLDGMKDRWAQRAEASEARVRELENASKQIRANAYAERYGELTGHKQRADTAESELARVRAELAAKTESVARLADRLNKQRDLIVRAHDVLAGVDEEAAK